MDMSKILYGEVFLQCENELTTTVGVWWIQLYRCIWRLLYVTPFGIKPFIVDCDMQYLVLINDKVT